MTSARRASNRPRHILYESLRTLKSSVPTASSGDSARALDFGVVVLFVQCVCVSLFSTTAPRSARYPQRTQRSSVSPALLLRPQERPLSSSQARRHRRCIPHPAALSQISTPRTRFLYTTTAPPPFQRPVDICDAVSLLQTDRHLHVEPADNRRASAQSTTTAPESPAAL